MGSTYQQLGVMVLTRIFIAMGVLSIVLAECPPEQSTQTSFLVTCPALMRSGTQAKLCATLLRPNETLHMSVYLVRNETDHTLLHKETSDQNFHRCFTFEVPLVTEDTISNVKVEVKGQTTFWTSKTLIKISPKHLPVTLIQTDKPIYTPGQTVHFRLVTMDVELIPQTQMYHLVTLEDSRGNLIAQWQNVTSQKKILQLSHILNSEAAQGRYTLAVAGQQTQERHHFQVKKYVPPKFDVTLSSPDKVSVGEAELQLEACARYTFKQPVPGEASFSLCRNLDRRHFGSESSTENICETKVVKMGKSGCVSVVFKMAGFTQDSNRSLGDSLRFEATITEEGTGISRFAAKTIRLNYSLGKAAFVDSPDQIQEGSPFVGKVKATHYNGTGIANTNVYLFKGSRWNAELLQNLTTDTSGVAQFTVNTQDISDDLSITASLTMDMFSIPYRSPYYESATKFVSIIKSGSSSAAPSSALTIKAINEPLACGKEISFTIKYAFQGEKFSTGTIDIVHLVLYRGKIASHGFSNASVSNAHAISEGEVSFTLTVIPEMAPSVQVLTYCILPSKTVLAGSRTFSTEKCFKNKVNIEFSPASAVPGESGSLQVSALPGSLCGLSVVDKSIMILEPGKGLTPDKVFDILPLLASYVNYDVEDPVECLKLRRRRSFGPYIPQPRLENEALTAFTRVGLKTVTNLVLRSPHCLLYKGRKYFQEHGYPEVAYTVSNLGRSEVDHANADVTIRSFFPETWIWKLQEVGESGVAQVPAIVPDTITTWETEAFCLSAQGFGLAPATQLTVFQPFFLEISLPYSIIRGEIFQLTATVYNYLSKCIMISVTPSLSPDYTLAMVASDQNSSCLCANERKTYNWALVPLVLGVVNVTVRAEAKSSSAMCGNEVVTVPERGAIDIVTRPLLVKAEGIEKTENYAWLLCPKGDALAEEVNLSLPQEIVNGTARVTVSVLGDILGRALKNIGDLLKMPYGCGEQNIATLSPNIHILQYLQNTGRLTPEIKEKATNFLKSGYQRQLNYKHPDGSYSAFGRGEGNTWLTAFVLRSFGQARAFTYIDPKVLADAKNWLDGTLNKDGVFQMKGKLFNNRMKGGINDDLTITAYVTAALLELDMNVMESTLDFLRSSITDLPNTYSTALLCYTLSLAGEEVLRGQLLKQLEDVATSEGNQLHWSQSKSEGVDPLAVETSCYVLLAILTKPTLTAVDLGKASRIVNWLVKQQSPYGGFSSTQDTVVALQALALYATNVFNPSGSSTVAVQSLNGEDRHRFKVDQQNALLYQEKALQDIPGKYSITVNGSACASVGMTLFYNVPKPTDQKALTIMAVTTPLNDGECNKANGQTLVLKITAQYNGIQDGTNMAVLNIKLLSGFSPDTSSLDALQHSLLVDRVDRMDDHVLIYLSEVPKGIPLNYQLIIRQSLPVVHLKPAIVNIYDYYQTSDQAEAEYSSPCSVQEQAPQQPHQMQIQTTHA